MHNDRHPWRTVFILCLSVLMVVIDNTIVNVALPTLARELHASTSGLQWIVDAYSLTFAALMLVGGGLADRQGRKWVLVGGLGAISAFALLATFSHSMSMLITARALMGAAAAFIFPATLSIITVTFADAKQRAAAIGAWGATAGIAVAIGPIVGGSLIMHFWYGSIFLVNVVTGLIAIVATITYVPNSKNPVERRVDSVGLVLGTVSVAALTWAIIEGPAWGWASASTLGLFAISLVTLVGFIAYELRREGPLLDVRIFSNTHFSAGVSAILVNFFVLSGFIFLVTQYFQMVRGYSPLSSGVRTLPFAIVVAVTTPIGAAVAAKVGARFVVPIGLTLFGAAMWWIGTMSATTAYFGPLVGSMVIMALGFALVNAPSTTVAMSTLRPDQVGAGAIVNETAREMGSTLGVAVVGSVFASLFGPSIRALFSPFTHRGLTSSELHVATSSMQGARVVAAHFPASLRLELTTHVTNSFLVSFHRGCFVAGSVAIISAVALSRTLPRGPLEATHPA